MDSAGPVGDYASLAFGPDGQPAIAYHDMTNDDLKFAHFSGSAWDLSIVDSAGSVGDYASLAFGPDGQPAIAYSDTNSYVKLARYNGNLWTSANVNSESFKNYGESLAFGPEGQPAIAYCHGQNGRVCLTRYDGIVWTNEVVKWISLNGNGYVSLAFGTDGRPVISYRDSGCVKGGELGDWWQDDIKFARYNGSVWTVVTVYSAIARDWSNCPYTPFSSDTSLSLGPDGLPAIVFKDYTTHSLKFSRLGLFTPAP